MVRLLRQLQALHQFSRVKTAPVIAAFTLLVNAQTQLPAKSLGDQGLLLGALIDHPTPFVLPCRAELAHNTSGWVVPVFSANVHEIRAYNRLAALARGKVVVVLQVCGFHGGPGDGTCQCIPPACIQSLGSQVRIVWVCAQQTDPTAVESVMTHPSATYTGDPCCPNHRHRVRYTAILSEPCACTLHHLRTRTTWCHPPAASGRARCWRCLTLCPAWQR